MSKDKFFGKSELDTIELSKISAEDLYIVVQESSLLECVPYAIEKRYTKSKTAVFLISLFSA